MESDIGVTVHSGENRIDTFLLGREGGGGERDAPEGNGRVELSDLASRVLERLSSGNGRPLCGCITQLFTRSASVSTLPSRARYCG